MDNLQEQMASSDFTIVWNENAKLFYIDIVHRVHDLDDDDWMNCSYTNGDLTQAVTHLLDDGYSMIPNPTWKWIMQREGEAFRKRMPNNGGTIYRPFYNFSLTHMKKVIAEHAERLRAKIRLPHWKQPNPRMQATALYSGIAGWLDLIINDDTGKVDPMDAAAKADALLKELHDLCEDYVDNTPWEDTK